MGGAFQDAPPIRNLNGGSFRMHHYNIWNAPLNIYYRKQKQKIYRKQNKIQKKLHKWNHKKYYINKSITEKHYISLQVPNIRKIITSEIKEKPYNYNLRVMLSFILSMLILLIILIDLLQQTNECQWPRVYRLSIYKDTHKHNLNKNWSTKLVA